MSGRHLESAPRPGRFPTTIIKNVELSDRYYLVVLGRPDGLPDPGPGTFVHLLLPESGRFFLRRPFSILDCDGEHLSLLVVEKGVGTTLLRRLPAGTDLDFLGPLGSVFPNIPGKNILAVAGGVGLAPLHYYGAALGNAAGTNYRLVYGARTKSDLFVDRFSWRVDGVLFSTDDGSHGFEGNVAQLAEHEIEREAPDVIFSCGPTPMLRAVAELARARGIEHYVSLETRMGCGVGACRACVVPSRQGGEETYKTVCHDGPVFDADDLVWDKLPEI